MSTNRSPIYGDQTKANLWATREIAVGVADRNQMYEEDGWTYKVLPCGPYFLIEVRDDADEFVGYL